MSPVQQQRPRPLRAPDLDSLLAYLYAPLAPLTQRIALRRHAHRRPDPAHILVPEGYIVELVATGLTTPVHCCFDEQGRCYVVECGHKVEARPRVLRVDVATGATETFFEIPGDAWFKTGAVTGACWHDGSLYLSNTDRVSRVAADGRVEDIVTGLPGLGDHQTNYPVVGPEGKLYFGVGSATNTGIVGADNYAYEWLQHFPEFCDVPGADVTLAGRNYAYRDVLGSISNQVACGAYVPFGTETTPGQVIPGSTKCSGSVLRCNPDGSALELVAWGLRNPYGLAFAPDGRLFATEHGIDERGRRYIVGDFDDLYEIRDGSWYGWPDFASGIPLTDSSWPDGRGREPLLAEHPDPHPPRPVVTFPPHAGANGLSFSTDERFGFVGDAFVALFGDVAPVTTRTSRPVGFKVVRVDVERREVHDFAVNTIQGPASRLPHRGMERPSHCAFGPDGALYVVDWGKISIAPEVGGIRMPVGGGVLWRIRRTSEPTAAVPPAPRDPPSYGIKVGLGAAAALAAAGLGLRRRARRGSR